MEASTSTTTPLPPALKSNAVRMTADRTANNNELHAHTNPLNVTFAERAEAFFLAQEHNLKETPTSPILLRRAFDSPQSLFSILCPIASVLILKTSPSNTIPQHILPQPLLISP
jgi:hypothetical protein